MRVVFSPLHPTADLAGKFDGLSVSAQSAAGGASGAAAGAKSVGRKPGPMGTVLITKQTRTKKKSLTCVSGLDEFGVKLKDLAKLLGKKFACGAAVVEGAVPGSEEIAIQGDFQEELAEFIAGTVPIAPCMSPEPSRRAILSV
jgi:density-regulated protein DRP1